MILIFFVFWRKQVLIDIQRRLKELDVWSIDEKTREENETAIGIPDSHLEKAMRSLKIKRNNQSNVRVKKYWLTKLTNLDHWLCAKNFQFAIINTSSLIFRPNLLITFGDNVEKKLMDFYPKLDLMYLTQIRILSCKCYSKYSYIELFLFYLCLDITF